MFITTHEYLEMYCFLWMTVIFDRKTVVINRKMLALNRKINFKIGKCFFLGR